MQMTMTVVPPCTQTLINFPHLNRLHGAECDIGEELCRGRGSKVQRCPVQV